MAKHSNNKLAKKNVASLTVMYRSVIVDGLSRIGKYYPDLD
jgi:hypothetical protein